MKPRIPTWAYIVAIALMLFGFLGAIGDVQGLFMGDIFDLQEQMIDDSSFNTQEEEEAWDDFFGEEFNREWDAMVDSINRRDALEYEIDSLYMVLDTLSVEADEQLISRVDSIQQFLDGEEGYEQVEPSVPMSVVEEDFMEDAEQVPKFMQKMFGFSDYQKRWTERFSLLGIFINLLFILAGILLLMMKRLAPTVTIIVLALSVLGSLARIAVLTSDPEGGSLISTFSWMGELFSIILDLALLITVLVVDKSMYRPVATPKAAPELVQTPKPRGDGEDF